MHPPGRKQTFRSENGADEAFCDMFISDTHMLRETFQLRDIQRITDQKGVTRERAGSLDKGQDGKPGCLWRAERPLWGKGSELFGGVTSPSQDPGAEMSQHRS